MFDDFSHFVRTEEPLAGWTWLRLGGPAEYFAEPTTEEELIAVVRRAREAGLPVHILGEGSNLLVRDEGVAGLVVSLAREAFRSVRIDDTRVIAGAGARLGHVITDSLGAGLTGLEPLVGVPGTIGAAVRGNSGTHGGSVGDLVRSVTVLNANSERQTLEGADCHFGYRESGLGESILLTVTLGLDPGDTITATRRMQTLWIERKATQPPSGVATAYAFRDVGGVSAAELIDQAGLRGTAVAGAELSSRDAHFIEVREGTKASDVLRLIELVRSQVAERTGVTLPTHLVIW